MGGWPRGVRRRDDLGIVNDLDQQSSSVMRDLRRSTACCTLKNQRDSVPRCWGLIRGLACLAILAFALAGRAHAQGTRPGEAVARPAVPEMRQLPLLLHVCWPAVELLAMLADRLRRSKRPGS